MFQRAMLKPPLSRFSRLSSTTSTPLIEIRFTLPESGGTLHVGTHTYFYGGGHAERDEKRAAQQLLPEWKDLLGKANVCVSEQKSTLWAEAPLVKEFGLTSLATPSWQGQAGDGPAIYELRRYQLKLGYDTVPEFLKLFREGLPSKLQAGQVEPGTSLATVLYTEVGSLNEVVEIWRHAGGTAGMERSRAAARGAAPWRSAVASIAELAVSFQATIHRPMACSPWK